MLSRLYVRNYALIEEQELLLANGFTVLTGETGAGKSILLGAFQLVLGQRADPDALRNKEEKCVVEAEFHLRQDFRALFEQLEMEYANPCIIRREIAPNGRSRAFVNDSPVLLDALRALGTQLVDIHSQHDQLLIYDDDFQLDLLDLLLPNQALLQQYSHAWERLKALEKEQAAHEKRFGSATDIDYLRYLLNELDELHPKESELKELEERIMVLRHAEAILQTAGGLLQQWDGDSGSPIEALGNVEAELQRLEIKWPEGSRLRDRLGVLTEELENWKRDLQEALEKVEHDPEALQWAEERLDAYNNLLHKHKLNSGDELLQLQEQLQQQLADWEAGEARKTELDQALEEAVEVLEKMALLLTKARQSVAMNLQKELAAALKRLELKDARLEAHLEVMPTIAIRGQDRLKWMFSANPGAATAPLQKVASGGELSRVMLALKAILATHRALPTVLFDEIDTGISGKTAASVAEVLKDLGQSIQLIAITHLPQIAAAGAQHLKVSKRIEKQQTHTAVEVVEAAERVEEIARLMSSAGITQAAKQQAMELLKHYGRN